MRLSRELSEPSWFLTLARVLCGAEVSTRAKQQTDPEAMVYGTHQVMSVPLFPRPLLQLPFRPSYLVLMGPGKEGNFPQSHPRSRSKRHYRYHPIRPI